jgi:gliding motility-associated-like protein
MKNLTIFYIVFICFCLTKTSNAQIVITKPNLGFTRACASPSFNTYNVTFSFTPVTALGSTNQFIVELSDETGDFTDATAIYTSAEGSVTTSPATLTFSVPTTISGEAYKLRIKSTAPVATSTSSNAFSAYYKIHDTPFTINNLISTGTYCTGGSYLLTIDNPGGADNDSPLQYDSLTFNWFKETSPTTSDFIQTSETLTVSEPGTYFVETNYGSCTSNSFSNRVTISEAGNGVDTEITSSLGNPYCSSEGSTILATTSGVSYQWYKDGEEIEGATNQTYVTNEAGEFTVNIDLGGCFTNATIDLDNGSLVSSIDVDEINNIEDGESLVATVTTDAVNPEFQWFFNDSLIPTAIGNSYEATETGDYKVIITQTTGCQTSSELLFSVTEAYPNVPNIPNIVSPNGDGINDTWIIPQAYVSGTNTEVTIISSQGTVELQTNDYQNNWPESNVNFVDINPVYYYIITTENNQTKKGSITLVK